MLNQTIVINESNIQRYNIWEHCFTKESLLTEARVTGFVEVEWYGDVSGKIFDEQGNIICAVFTKQG